MTTYRWNTSDFAIGYDAAAETIHPHYLAIQDAILHILHVTLDSRPLTPDSPVGRGSPDPAPPLIVDLGGGSGRLIERILDAWPLVSAIIVDQSEPFLALAERRLARFGHRATCILARLQDDWPAQLPGPATAFVSMSAIHHLEPAEKETLYRRCFDLLAPGGVLLNGDEVRAPGDDDYLAILSSWADHMRRHMASNAIPAIFHGALHGWIDRNVTRFGQPKKSGDDCHETIDVQLAYFRSAGFTTIDSPWHRDLWAILRGVDHSR
jgi:tRNA (cmo5U34)-methyltransferase